MKQLISALCIIVIIICVGIISITLINKEPDIYKSHINYSIVTATCYRAEVGQCDNTPFITADNSVIDVKNIDKLRWIAISRDLNEEYKMGDSVLVSGIDSIYDGVWIIHDRMNKRFKNKIDFLISKELKAGLFENVKIIKL